MRSSDICEDITNGIVLEMKTSPVEYEVNYSSSFLGWMLHLFYLEDSVLAALDGLAELFCTLSIQTLVKDLLKRVDGVVHLLFTRKNKTTSQSHHVSCVRRLWQKQCYIISCSKLLLSEGCSLRTFQK